MPLNLLAFFLLIIIDGDLIKLSRLVALMRKSGDTLIVVIIRKLFVSESY